MHGADLQGEEFYMPTIWKQPREYDSDSWPYDGQQIVISVDRDGITTPLLMFGDSAMLDAMIRGYGDKPCACVRWCDKDELARESIR